MLKLDLQYFAGAVDTWHIYVKSNDGSTQLFEAWSTSNTTVTITESGFTLSGGTIYGDGSTYTYEGNKTLLGFATSANATEPTYTTGDTLTLTADGVNMHLYIVEGEAEPTTSGVTVEYDGSVVAIIPSGNKATIPVADKKMKTDIVITVPEAEVLPEFTEVEDFAVLANGADEGSLELAYSVSQDVKLSAASPAPLVSIDDANFIANNIKKDVSIFGLTGAYEGETVEEYDGTISIADLVKLISFTISSTSYQAEEGMTWSEWVESDYNTGNYQLNGYAINKDGNGSKYVANSSGDFVTPSDTIISGHAYSMQSSGEPA